MDCFRFTTGKLTELLAGGIIPGIWRNCDIRSSDCYSILFVALLEESGYMSGLFF
nr:hypothetical protein [Paenimyroides ceti]